MQNKTTKTIVGIFVLLSVILGVTFSQTASEAPTNSPQTQAPAPTIYVKLKNYAVSYVNATGYNVSMTLWNNYNGASAVSLFAFPPTGKSCSWTTQSLTFSNYEQKIVAIQVYGDNSDGILEFSIGVLSGKSYLTEDYQIVLHDNAVVYDPIIVNTTIYMSNYTIYNTYVNETTNIDNSSTNINNSTTNIDNSTTNFSNTTYNTQYSNTTILTITTPNFRQIIYIAMIGIASALFVIANYQSTSSTQTNMTESDRRKGNKVSVGNCLSFIIAASGYYLSSENFKPTDHFQFTLGYDVANILIGFMGYLFVQILFSINGKELGERISLFSALFSIFLGLYDLAEYLVLVILLLLPMGLLVLTWFSSKYLKGAFSSKIGSVHKKPLTVPASQREFETPRDFRTDFRL